MGVEAPQEYGRRDLKADGCPCGCIEFEEFPAGYYHCTDCRSEWAGVPTKATLVTYFPPEDSS